ncbi:hypothetical protein [Streptomyces sp. NPDC005336]|uniref:AMP-binding enzyme n=1 Tax=Streptomyces sp. NPDC005336 TaxID=3157035 RepID=UPI0033B7185D
MIKGFGRPHDASRDPAIEDRDLSSLHYLTCGAAPMSTERLRRAIWLHTGDVGHFDHDGYLFITDRKKDMIIFGGMNVFPSEVEQVIWSHPGGQDCAVIGIPHEDWGEMVTAVVERNPGASVDDGELIALCKERLGSVRAPKRVEFVDSLPAAPTGRSSSGPSASSTGPTSPGRSEVASGPEGHALSAAGRGPGASALTAYAAHSDPNCRPNRLLPTTLSAPSMSHLNKTTLSGKSKSGSTTAGRTMSHNQMLCTLTFVENEYGVRRMLGELQLALRAGAYRPAPARRVDIVRRAAPCCIPDAIGRNLENVSGSDGLPGTERRRGQ